MTPLDTVENAIVDLRAGRIDRAQAIARIRSVLNLTEAGAADLIDHPVDPRTRYEQAGREAAEILRRLDEPVTR